MIIATQYTIEYDEPRGAYRLRGQKAPLCPDCGLLLSGYDTRRRHVIDGTGVARWFLLRRLRCPSCGKLHLEAPDIMQPKKHYEAALIDDVLAGRSESCPADDSTIRRWRVGKHPPGSPVHDDAGAVCSLHTEVNQSKGGD
ncbi:DUF6431 domain-containing protein [Ruminiclostridium josui]|uniref:DUF6431 domain-containing protein n=1 Tax=Ruminiclostridium josui TaxID=1499 RepID=UPI0009DCF4E5|nr:DUF6431 domain-containing protein [Ruminiclostridium josui]